MRFLGNIIWFLFGGMLTGLTWALLGILWCVTIIGIPVGLQCFKFAALSFFPFGRELRFSTRAVSFLLNILWVVTSGLPLALEHLTFGILFCITIIGIPFGLQLFKMAGLALWPFGHDVQSDTNDGGCLAIMMNVIWILCGGLEIAFLHIFFGALCCVTIVGIPFGLQHFKMAILAVVPFGKKIS